MTQDKFSHLRGQISRQRIYQLRHQAMGLCAFCSNPAIPDLVYCVDHAKRISKKKLRQRMDDNPDMNRKTGRWVGAPTHSRV